MKYNDKEKTLGKWMEELKQLVKKASGNDCQLTHFDINWPPRVM